MPLPHKSKKEGSKADLFLVVFTDRVWTVDGAKANDCQNKRDFFTVFVSSNRIE
jgi:hypothetical protein